ncbi:multicopper oxidase domain-containing protein [Aurantimonas aggregata]|uniref:multicopper oxidase domain-containing protein n=1 Tax=Aurantimonas aggregata TaxID=2047720 RepID=UPI003CCD740A
MLSRGDNHELLSATRLSVGALRGTVYVPPMSMVDVALDAGEAARWMLHCHHMPYLATGMMTEFAVMASV